MPPKKVMQSYSESSKLAERLYPQMLQTTVCLNVPTWFSMVMKVRQKFFFFFFFLFFLTVFCSGGQALYERQNPRQIQGAPLILFIFLLIFCL
jgi:hypothetical protein